MTTGGVGKGQEKDTFAPSSTFIETVIYDPEAKSMDITFRSGSKVRYVDVNPSTFLTFKQSPTHSAFYARAIKGNLQSVKIVDNSIGTQSSTPLKHVQRTDKLNAGLKREQARNERIYGTVDRAINAAVINS